MNRILSCRPILRNFSRSYLDRQKIVSQRSLSIQPEQEIKITQNSSKAISRAPVQPLRGTKDMYPNETRYFNHFEKTFISVLTRYGYANEIRTPILEHQSVFEATLGDTSDVVMKQMYSFDDNGIPTVLRPENTASVVRAVLHRGPLTNNLAPKSSRAISETTEEDNLQYYDPATHSRLQPFENFTYSDKYYYIGPMFRRERPQAGRYRQFTQFGLECIGSDSVLDDVQILTLANEALHNIGIRDMVTLKINSIGDSEDRKRYSDALSIYFSQYRDYLSEDSVKRLDAGFPERILDSKSPQDKYIYLGEKLFSESEDAALFKTMPFTELRPELQSPVGAPTINEYLSEASKQRFDTIVGLLDIEGIQYEIDPYLFRGLDYYCHTTFEFIVKNTPTLPKSPVVGSAVLAGGRYNNLSTRFAARTGKGVVEMSAMGWAAGFERIMLHLQHMNKLPALPAQTQIAVVGMTFKVKEKGLYTSAFAELATDKLIQKQNFDEVMKILSSRAATANATLATDKHNTLALAQAQALVDFTTLRVASYLRKQGIAVECNTDKPFRQQLGVATNQLACKHIFIIGTDEIEKKSFGLKDLILETQTQIPAVEESLLEFTMHNY